MVWVCGIMFVGILTFVIEDTCMFMSTTSGTHFKRCVHAPSSLASSPIPCCSISAATTRSTSSSSFNAPVTAAATVMRLDPLGGASSSATTPMAEYLGVRRITSCCFPLTPLPLPVPPGADSCSSSNSTAASAAGSFSPSRARASSTQRNLRRGTSMAFPAPCGRRQSGRRSVSIVGSGMRWPWRRRSGDQNSRSR